LIIYDILKVEAPDLVNGEENARREVQLQFLHLIAFEIDLGEQRPSFH
jgi:hypothetical protein